MKSILRRLVLILKAWLHALLSPAEDPRKLFAFAYQRQQELLGRVRLAQSNVAAAREQLEGKVAGMRDKQPELEEQARRALVGGREDLARFALQLRQVAAAELQELRELEREEHMLSLVEQRLTTQIEAFSVRQEVMEARYSTAEAHVHVHEALGGVSEELADLGVALERAEQRTEDMQARVSAIDELVEMGILEMPRRGPGPTTASAVLGSGGPGDVELRLAALKREINVG